MAAEGLGTVLAMLDERRVNLTAARTRLVNQLHALLRDLLPGGAPTELTADKATALLRGLRAAGPVEHTRRDLARDVIAEVRAIDNRLTAGARQMSEVLREHGSLWVPVTRSRHAPCTCS